MNTVGVDLPPSPGSIAGPGDGTVKPLTESQAFMELMISENRKGLPGAETTLHFLP